MPSQTFYWVGSTADSNDSLSWSGLGNWRTLVIPNTPGATVATLSAADRFPMGGDIVYFGHSTEPAGKYEPVAPVIYSPLLFGGTSTGNTLADGATAQWYGSTAGGTTLERFGEIYLTVRPTYPFSQIGGDLTSTVLNEWAETVRNNGYPNTSLFVLDPGKVEGTTSATFSISVFSGTGGFGVSRPTDFENEKYIRVKGTVTDYSQSPTKCFFRGVTGACGSGITAYKVDGSENFYKRGSAIVRPYGTAQNSGASTGTVPTPNGSIYTHGSVSLAGNWNSITQINNSTGGDIELDSLNANLIQLSPNHGYENTTASYPNHYTTRTNSTSYSGFNLGNLTMSQTSTARYLILGTYGTVGYMNSIGVVNIEGDITPNGGFTCAVQASAGLSGGSTNTEVFPGSLWLSPPIGEDDSVPPVCTIGYPSTSANLKAQNLTTITNLYSNAGVGPEWNIEIQGNFTTTNLYSFGGTVYVSPYIGNNDTLTITNIIANGVAVVDLSRAPSYRGFVSTVKCYSTGVRIIPNIGTRLTLGSDELASEQ
jgi:hypothetical protein